MKVDKEYSIRYQIGILSGDYEEENIAAGWHVEFISR